MSNTTTNIAVPVGTVVNVYTASGITVGTQVKVQVVESDRDLPVLFYVGSSTPTAATITAAHTTCAKGAWVRNDSGDTGLYAYCRCNATINVSPL